MNILSLISAVIISSLTPVAVPELSGIKDGRAVFVDEVAVVAVIPEAFVGIEEKTESLKNATESLGEIWGREVILTEDLLTYMTLSRIEKRGADDYERKNLVARLSRIKSYCYASQKIV